MALLAIFLKPLEWLFSLCVAVRMGLYDARILRREHLGCLVVVIGNITVGGTGKTPVVEKFARELIKKGRRVAILSRGYKRKEAPLLRKLLSLFDPEISASVVVSAGKGRPLCDWKSAGDEPYMLAMNLPEAIVIVDKNRVRAGSLAIRKYKADTLLLDDGFQYLPLKSRLQLLLVDQKNPFGNTAMLPAGVLREGVGAMKRADYIFITKSDGAPPRALLETIAKYGPTGNPIICAHVPKSLNALDGSNVEPLEILKGKKVLAFSGIAVPQSFEELLEHAGAHVLRHMRYADHYAYEPEDHKQIVRIAEEVGAEMIVTTEKDAVRLSLLETEIPSYYLRMEVEILSGASGFSEAVEEICFGAASKAPMHP